MHRILLISLCLLIAGVMAIRPAPIFAQAPAATATAPLPSITLPPALDRVLRDYERAWRARIIGAYARESGEPDIGKFVLALRRTSGGPWRIAADMDNGNGPPRR